MAHRRTEVITSHPRTVVSLRTFNNPPTVGRLDSFLPMGIWDGKEDNSSSLHLDMVVGKGKVTLPWECIDKVDPVARLPEDLRMVRNEVTEDTEVALLVGEISLLHGRAQSKMATGAVAAVVAAVDSNGHSINGMEVHPLLHMAGKEDHHPCSSRVRRLLLICRSTCRDHQRCGRGVVTR